MRVELGGLGATARKKHDNVRKLYVCVCVGGGSLEKQSPEDIIKNWLTWLWRLRARPSVVRRLEPSGVKSGKSNVPLRTREAERGKSFVSVFGSTQAFKGSGETIHAGAGMGVGLFLYSVCWCKCSSHPEAPSQAYQEQCSKEHLGAHSSV